jgi:hypothetical protein
MFYDPATRVLLRTRPSPITPEQAARLRGARPAGPPPRPSAEPVRVQRRASATGVIMVAGQKIALGRVHAGQTVTVLTSDTTLTLTIDLGDGKPRSSPAPPHSRCAASKASGRGPLTPFPPDLAQIRSVRGRPLQERQGRRAVRRWWTRQPGRYPDPGGRCVLAVPRPWSLAAAPAP